MLIFIYHHLFKLLRDTDFISFSCFLQMLQSESGGAACQALLSVRLLPLLIWELGGPQWRLCCWRICLRSNPWHWAIQRPNLLFHKSPECYSRHQCFRITWSGGNYFVLSWISCQWECMYVGKVRGHGCRVLVYFRAITYSLKFVSVC